MNLHWSHITLFISTVSIVAVWATSFVVTQNKKVEKIHYSIESVDGARNLITVKEIKKMVDEVYDLDASKILIA